MCINPIQLKKVSPVNGKVRVNLVPCGKCPECLGRAHSQFAAQCVLEALAHGTMQFLTFTYNQESCPVAVSEMEIDGPRVVAFERGAFRWYDGKRFKNGVINDNGVSYACSLYRKDIQNLLKLFRQYRPQADFRFACFGEYGDRKGRPHYHMLLFGLSASDAHFLSNLWKFGDVDVKYIPDFNPKDKIKVSNYVSKYIVKGTYSHWLDLLPYVEKPRRQASLRLGLSDPHMIHKLWYLCNGVDMGITSPSGKLLRYPSDAEYEILLRRQSTLNVAGRDFAFPLNIKHKILYNVPDYVNGIFVSPSDRQKNSLSSKIQGLGCPNSLQRLVSAFARDKYNLSFDETLSRYSKTHFKQDTHRFIVETLASEANALCNREVASEQIIQSNIVKQKFD